MNRLSFVSDYSRTNQPEHYKISEIKDDIVASFLNHKITFVSSPTGSGKSTQIPLYILPHATKVVCCEPRKIACDSICDFLYKICNGEKKISCNSYYDYYRENFDILFLTENSLLSIISKDPTLSRCDALIIDEVHERTTLIELILFYMKHITLPRRDDFKIIITSASFDVDNIWEYFSEKFGEDSIGVVKQDYPQNYDIIYQEAKLFKKYNSQKITDQELSKVIKQACKLIKDELYYQYNESNSGSQLVILVFLPDIGCL